MTSESSHLPFNFCGLERPLSDYDDARFVVLPVPFEGTVSYQKGTARGPDALIDASRNLETYDEMLGFEVASLGIHTMEAVTETDSVETMLAEVHRIAADVLADKKLLVTVGGEHSISSAPARAAKEVFDDLSVLQLDAHADLRDAYDGTPWSHACVMRRCLEFAPVTQVGIRSLSAGEAALLKTEPHVTTFFAHEVRAAGLRPMHDEILSTLTDEVYLTIDIDVFDPSCVPGTGTPEPGGLFWDEVVGFLRALTREKQVVAFDLTELMPLPGNAASDFLAAKLVYRTMGLIAEAARWIGTT